MRKIDWKMHLSNQKKSGLSIEKYCKSNNLTPSSFYYYKKKLKDTSADKKFIPVRVLPAKADNVTYINLSIDSQGVVSLSGQAENIDLLHKLLRGRAS